MVLEETIGLPESIGFFNFILPFLLVFVVLYSILKMTKIFGEGMDSSYAIISLVVALFVMYFGRIYQLGPFFAYFLSRGAIYLIIFVIAAVVSNFLNVVIVDKMFQDSDDKQKMVYKGIIFFITAGVVYATLASSPFVGPIVFGGEAASIGGDMLVSIFVLILVFGLMYMIVTGV